MNYTYPVYVCDHCNFCQYHPLSYCPKCPGRLRLVRKEISSLQSFRDEQHIKDYLKSQGLDYFGEYPKFPKVTE